LKEARFLVPKNSLKKPLFLFNTSWDLICIVWYVFRSIFLIRQRAF